MQIAYSPNNNLEEYKKLPYWEVELTRSYKVEGSNPQIRKELLQGESIATWTRIEFITIQR